MSASPSRRDVLADLLLACLALLGWRRPAAPASTAAPAVPPPALDRSALADALPSSHVTTYVYDETGTLVGWYPLDPPPVTLDFSPHCQVTSFTYDLAPQPPEPEPPQQP